jgi:hypothetical protein
VWRHHTDSNCPHPDEQLNAVAAARQYLGISAFSHNGLIEQLNPMPATPTPRPLTAWTRPGSDQLSDSPGGRAQCPDVVSALVNGLRSASPSDGR